uniref:HSF-type DNA-binding domain-containing protein n=1 Tax=Pseudo-nitzschia australis TaxID=44445 RepID=A0A7S4ENY5_9STRA
MSICFPCRLHDLLNDAEKNGYDHIISWSPDGKSFKIHETSLMVPILQRYFRQTKYQSFQRQLHGYGFHRNRYGEGKGEVSHPLFVHGQRAMSKEMRRKSGTKMSQHNTMPSTSNIPLLPYAGNSKTSKIAIDDTASVSTPCIDPIVVLSWTLDPKPCSTDVVDSNCNHFPADNRVATERMLMVPSTINPGPFPPPIIRTSTNPNFAPQRINIQQQEMQALRFLQGVMPTIVPPTPMAPPIVSILPALVAQPLPQIMPPILSTQTIGESTQYIDVIKAAYLLEAKLKVDRILKEYPSAGHNHIGNSVNELEVKSRIELAYMMYLESQTNRL